MNDYLSTVLENVLEFFIPIIIERLIFISYLLVFIFTISLLIMFNKEIVLCKRKSQKLFIYLILTFTVFSSIITIPFYLLLEDQICLNKYSEQILKTELMYLSNQGILPNIKYIHKPSIVGGSPTIWEYYVKTSGDEGASTFLVWLNTPFHYIEVDDDNVYIKSVHILKNCEKILLFEKESKS